MKALTLFPTITLLLVATAFDMAAQPQQIPTRLALTSGPPDTLWSAPIESFKFAGGTLDDFCRQLQPLVPGIDRIESNKGGDEKIPPFEVGKTTLSELLSRVRWLLKNRPFDYSSSSSMVSGEAQTVLVLEIPSTFQNGDNGGIYLPEVDFKGGNGNDLAACIEKLGMNWDNIHVSPSATTTRIPAFHVKRVTFQELRSILDDLTSHLLTLSWTGTFLKIDAGVVLPISGRTETAILPLQDLLESYRIEDVNALVQTALDMRNKRIGNPAPEPLMSLHKETKTLIVVGDKDQVAVVRAVVDTLNNQPKPLEERETPEAH